MKKENLINKIKDFSSLKLKNKESLHTRYEKFSDNSAPIRIQIMKECRDPIHIYELLLKYFGGSVDDLKMDYDVKLDMIRDKISFSGEPEKIYKLFQFLLKMGFKQTVDDKEVKKGLKPSGVKQFESIEIDQLGLNLSFFLTKVL